MRDRRETTDRYQLFGDSIQGARLPFDPVEANNRADAILVTYIASATADFGGVQQHPSAAVPDTQKGE